MISEICKFCMCRCLIWFDKGYKMLEELLDEWDRLECLDIKLDPRLDELLPELSVGFRLHLFTWEGKLNRDELEFNDLESLELLELDRWEEREDFLRLFLGLFALSELQSSSIICLFLSSWSYFREMMLWPLNALIDSCGCLSTATSRFLHEANRPALTTLVPGTLSQLICFSGPALLSGLFEPNPFFLYFVAGLTCASFCSSSSGKMII